MTNHQTGGRSRAKKSNLHWKSNDLLHDSFGRLWAASQCRRTRSEASSESFSAHRRKRCDRPTGKRHSCWNQKTAKILEIERETETGNKILKHTDPNVEPKNLTQPWSQINLCAHLVTGYSMERAARTNESMAIQRGWRTVCGLCVKTEKWNQKSEPINKKKTLTTNRKLYALENLINKLWTKFAPSGGQKATLANER